MGPRINRRLVAAGIIGGILAAAFGYLALEPVGAAQEVPAFGIPADDARQIAQDILDDPRFTSRQNETIFTRIGRAISGLGQRIIQWLNRVVLGVGDDSTGGRLLFWTIVTVLIVIVTVIVATKLARRRSEAAALERQSTGSTKNAKEDLERQADLALSEGRNEDAVRLYYRAGLIQLGDKGRIDYRPSMTSGEVADTLRLAVFDHIARNFDSIAYGKRPASNEQAATSKHAWRELLGKEGQ